MSPRAPSRQLSPSAMRAAEAQAAVADPGAEARKKDFQAKAQIGQAVQQFFVGTPEPPGPPCQAQALKFDPCKPLTLDGSPEFVLPFRRPIILTNLRTYDAAVDDALSTPLAALVVSRCRVDLGLDPHFEQTWTLTALHIGDLASTMSLAPSEQLTLEFQQSQRKLLDQTVVDSNESIDSSESTTSDKEAINVARATTKSSGWHVDVTGEVTVGYASLKTTAGFQNTVRETNQQAVNLISERTKKSAHSLEALHKIEVRGVTETTINNRMTRVIKNPYFESQYRIETESWVDTQ